ncbi:phosphotransferase enzyme family protein [Paractinoplanes deccanensis]|nr:phosphotransferase [Actinoplanes deccanensis]
MRERPEGVGDDLLAEELAAGWGIRARSVDYLPVGAGGYHWSVEGAWFVTVAEWSAGLEQALRTAAELASELDFVVAPVPTGDGAVVRRLADRYALSVYPLLAGTAGSFGPHRDEDRDAVLDLLIRLHATRAASAPRADLVLPGRDQLHAGPRGPWAGGPYAEPARRLLAEHAGSVAERLARFDALAGALPPPRDWVVTHGEPHPGNILWTAEGLRLIDWDTVQVAPAERDIWMLTGAESRYERVTGRRVSEAAVEFYRLWWTLADIAGYTADLRGPHTEGPDAAAALRHLAANLEAR